MNTPDFDFDSALRRAIGIFRLTGVPVRDHFRAIYLSGTEGVRRDWRFSELACSMIILSAGAANYAIQEIQDDLLDFYGL